MSATVATGIMTIALSPLAIGIMPIAGAVAAKKYLSASKKRKESNQLKDEIYAILCDYVGYIPNT